MTLPAAAGAIAGPQLGVHRPALLVVLAAGWLALFGPSYAGLAGGLWAEEAHGHGPLIGVLAAWLLWQRRGLLATLPQHAASPAPATAWAGGTAFGAGLLLLVLGQSQGIPTLQMAAQLPVVSGLLLLFAGPAGVRAAAFPLGFLLFMVPWPASWVEATTQPLKLAVSAVAVDLLAHTGHAVGRAGVVITIGPYQLLVADACAGLNSVFTLEALGLLYMSLLPDRSLSHKVVLALCIPLLAFAANVVRVLLLSLITLHAGEAAGRGFGHDFSAATLFAVALLLVYATDKALTLVPWLRSARD